MRFGRPEILWVFLVLPLLVPLIMWSVRRRRRTLRSFGKPEILKRLLPSIPWEWRFIRGGALLLGALFFLLAAAEPQWGSRNETLHLQGVDIVVTLDTSRSMLAEDISPNRLERAKAEISQFLRSLHGDRVALVPFAGTSYIHCPLTSDYAAVRIFLEILDAGLLPVPGTAIGDAIRTSLKAFPDGQGRHQVILLLTDGEDHGSDPLGAAREASERGVRIYTIGLGSPAGELIPIRRESGAIQGYEKDEKGQVVTTRLDETTLEKISLATGGAYYRSTSGEMELDRLIETIQGMGKREYEGRNAIRLEHRYQIPLALALLLLVLEFCLPLSLPRWSARASRSRWGKGLTTALMAVLFLIAGAPAIAGSAAAKVRQGNKLYTEGNYQEAMKKYTEAQIELPDAPQVRYNQGNVLYRLGRYPEALEEYRRARSTPDRVLSQATHFNIGNTLFRMGTYEDAIVSYEQALTLDPSDVDAKRNLELAAALLKQQEKQKQEQQEQGEQEPDEQPSSEETPEPQAGEEEKPTPETRPEPNPSEDHRMSREEALRILDALQEDEKESLLRGLRLPKEGRARGGKNW